MKKFEYNQLYISFKSDGTNHLEQLNIFGKEGWELTSCVKVDIDNILYIFKREILTDLVKKQLLMEKENIV